MVFTNKKNNGFAMVEAIISVAVIILFVFAFENLIVKASAMNHINQYKFQASLYLKELIEIAVDLEQSDWDALIKSDCASPNICHPIIISNKWDLIAGEEFLENNVYRRDISVFSVCRDQLVSPSNIINCPSGVPDPDTKKVVATIFWNDGYDDNTLTLESYVYSY